MIYATRQEFWTAIEQAKTDDEKLDILFNDDFLETDEEEAAE